MFELNQKLKKTDEKFKILFELSPIGMALVDHKTGKILEVNQTLLDATGYTKDEFLSLFFSDIIPEKYYYQEKQQLKDLKKKGKFGPNEKEYIRKDGTFCPVKINGFSFVDMDGSKVVWVLIEDITVTKQYELIYQDQKELLEYIAVEKKLQKILDKIVFLSEKRTPGTKCSILLVDESGEHLINGSAPSLPKFYNDAINGVAIGEKVGSCGSAAFKKQRVIVGNIDTHKNWQSFLALTQKANLHACWSEPIISSDNQILGTFAIYSSEPKAPCEFELKLIETYANIASKAIEKHNYTKHIKESQIELEQLFNNSYSGLLYLDENRTIIKVNKRFADMMGYDNADEFVGMSAESLHLNHERYLEFGKKRFYTLITNLGNFNIEYQLKRKDGSALWCELSGKALDAKVPADLSKGVLWTVNDISLRKKYEKQLNEKQLQLKNILVTIPDMVWLKDSKGVHMICNPAYETFFSASNKEIIGKTDYDLVDKKMADFFKSTDEKAMGSKDVITYEKWLECVDNNKKVLFEVSKKAMRNTQGEILGVLGIGHDVTQRKLREEKLQELNALAKSLTKEQQNLLSLFDKGDSVLFKWRNDKDWSVEYVSKSVKKLLGLSQKKFQKNKKAYSSFVHKDYVQKVKDEVQNVLENKLDYFNYEPYKIVTKNNEEKWVLEHTITQKDKDGKITYFIGYITDITKQVENQQMLFNQSKIASLGEMLGNISHQWRQPLSMISTVATGTKLKKELDLLDDEELLANMDSINKNAQYLSNTIDDFRNFFLGDTYIKEEYKIKDSIKKVISLIKDSYKSSNIIIIENLDEEFSFFYNENLLIQALINIFNNAKDALNQMKNKEIQKYVFVTLSEDKDNYKIEIKDNAGGVKKENIDKLFEPYFTTKHKSLGTGIGLYMTNQIISKHLSGSIYVKNSQYKYLDESFKGASFNILIPFSKDI